MTVCYDELTLASTLSTHSVITPQYYCQTQQSSECLPECGCRLFVPQLCSRCLGTVNAHELVMYARQQIYHVDCFVCTVCERRLNTGEHFAMQRNAIYCQVHAPVRLFYRLICLMSSNSTGTPAIWRAHEKSNPKRPKAVIFFRFDFR